MIKTNFKNDTALGKYFMDPPAGDISGLGLRGDGLLLLGVRGFYYSICAKGEGCGDVFFIF